MPYPPPGVDIDADGRPYHARSFGEPFPPIPPASSDFKLPPPLSTTRIAEFTMSLDGPVKADGKRLVIGTPLRGGAPIGRRREDDAALRMFS